jgi:mRNA-degrading endonuclease RelE of RelBE toxin-antitoxin system
MKRLVKQHRDLIGIFADAIAALRSDPYNRPRKHAIKKLEGVTAGEGAYRLRSGRFRFRYDIDGNEVVLHHCGLRREDTYR